MFKIRIILILAAIFSTQQIFAEDMSDMSMSMDSPDGKPCMVIADACSKAGFERGGSEGKRFWFDCMKPIIMGKTVSGVTVDAATAKACRSSKIEKMKKEMKEFQNVK